MRIFHLFLPAAAALLLAGCAAFDGQERELRIALEPGENVWGGRVADGRFAPYGDGFSTSLVQNEGNQVTPLLLTSAGRYVWSDAPFDFRVEGETLVLENLHAEVQQGKPGTTLREAYRYGMKTWFPPEGGIPPEEFFDKPQYNTWIELQYNQNQEGVLRYAHGILDNDLPPGILMIDDTWMEDYGKWVFHPGRFPDPKAMCDELHRLGFKIMLWICPFVSMDQYQIWTEVNRRGAFIKDGKGDIYPVRWWNGTSAALDFSAPAAFEWLSEQLDALQEEYGVDGFKFDACDFWTLPEDGVTQGNIAGYELCALFSQFGLRYPYNEFRAGWKMGGRPLVQRLHDKVHSWEALQRLVPEMMATNLLGYWYSCPDMVGGGSFGSFLPGAELDQDLVVRSAQTHALMPMMQFSVAPWRILDADHYAAVLEAVAVRDRFLPEIKSLVRRASETGEPVVAPLEFVFPHEGLAGVKDEFMLGDRILVAPCVTPGTSRDVVLPPGRWQADDGQVYDGGRTVSVAVPLERIPVFRLL